MYLVVAAEFTNWRREQRAWRETAVLYDQTHHMVNLFFQGPDALKLISDTAINSVETFPVDMAKQYVPTTPAGNVIGDGILFHLAQDEFVFVGRAPAANWLEFQAEAGATTSRWTRTTAPDAPDGQGGDAQGLAVPGAGPERLAGAREAQRRLDRGRQVLPHEHHEPGRAAGSHAAPRHGRRPGLELWGPYETYDEVRETILEAGKEFGLEMVGSRAYSSNTLESGWIPSPLPAIYTGEELRARTASG